MFSADAWLCQLYVQTITFCPVYPCWTLPGSTSPFWIVRCACFFACPDTFALRFFLCVCLFQYFCSVSAYVPITILLFCFCSCSDIFALFLCLTVPILLPVQMFGAFLLLKPRFCIRPHEPRKRTCTVLSASTEASSPSCFCPKNYTSQKQLLFKSPAIPLSIISCGFVPNLILSLIYPTSLVLFVDLLLWATVVAKIHNLQTHRDDL